MSKYNSIRIRDAMEKIASNHFVLPAIQRKFVWRPNQIEMLFDSIMRGYPINSFMLWEISNSEIKNNYKFYSFIKDYIDKFNEDNPDAPTSVLQSNFYAVIDGQQRLTSLYVGLTGSYRYKRPSKWFKNNEDVMPTRRLYLDLREPFDTSIDNENQYNFKFLTNSEIEQSFINNDNIWFKVANILTFEDLSDVNRYLIEQGLSENQFAMKTLVTLFQRINGDELINYYTETEQNQDKVLDVFIRTNSGGTPLSFSALLMSIASANWKKYDARDEMKKLKEEIYELGNPRFDVSQDVILKSLLVLSDIDVKFKIQNFGRINVRMFEEKWIDIRKSILSAFVLLEKLGFNDSLLRAKNAVIPIAYYIYKNNLSAEIVKDNFCKNDLNRISKWLTISLLKGIFGGTSDSVLRNLRTVISESSSKAYFPLKEITEKFKGEADKNYSFDIDFVNALVEEQYGSVIGSLTLFLLYPSLLLQHGKSIAQDHMHPKTMFIDKEKLNSINVPESEKKFFADQKNWNGLGNIQLLSETENKSKGDSPLILWASKNGILKKDLFIGEETDLEIKYFKAFIETRKKHLVKELQNILLI